MKKLKGFTLIELVITISIIIILSSISVPLYRKHILNAKFSEAYTLLGSILSAQLTYRNETACFLGYGHASYALDGKYEDCVETVLGVDARSNRYFTKFNINDDCIGKKYSFSTYTYGKYGRLKLVYSLTAGGATFYMTTA